MSQRLSFSFSSESRDITPTLPVAGDTDPISPSESPDSLENALSSAYARLLADIQQNRSFSSENNKDLDSSPFRSVTKAKKFKFLSREEKHPKIYLEDVYNEWIDKISKRNALNVENKTTEKIYETREYSSSLRLDFDTFQVGSSSLEINQESIDASKAYKNFVELITTSEKTTQNQFLQRFSHGKQSEIHKFGLQTPKEWYTRFKTEVQEAIVATQVSLSHTEELQRHGILSLNETTRANYVKTLKDALNNNYHRLEQKIVQFLQLQPAVENYFFGETTTFTNLYDPFEPAESLSLRTLQQHAKQAFQEFSNISKEKIVHPFKETHPLTPSFSLQDFYVGTRAMQESMFATFQQLAARLEVLEEAVEKHSQETATSLSPSLVEQLSTISMLVHRFFDEKELQRLATAFKLVICDLQFQKEKQQSTPPPVAKEMPTESSDEEDPAGRLQTLYDTYLPFDELSRSISHLLTESENICQQVPKLLAPLQLLRKEELRVIYISDALTSLKSLVEGMQTIASSQYPSLQNALEALEKRVKKQEETHQLPSASPPVSY